MLQMSQTASYGKWTQTNAKRAYGTVRKKNSGNKDTAGSRERESVLETNEGKAYSLHIFCIIIYIIY